METPYRDDARAYIGSVMVTAMGFIVALAVNTAFEKLLNTLFPHDDSLQGYITYAIITVTVIVLFTWYTYQNFPEFYPRYA